MAEFKIPVKGGRLVVDRRPDKKFATLERVEVAIGVPSLILLPDEITKVGFMFNVPGLMLRVEGWDIPILVNKPIPVSESSGIEIQTR